MKTIYALLIAAAGAPLATSAQQPAAAPYQSAFAGYHRTPDVPQTPDQVWRQANREVGAPGPGSGPMHHGSAATGAVCHSKMDHGTMSHGTPHHGAADHGKMDHGKMDHGKMDHGGMHHGSNPPEAAGQAKHGSTQSPPRATGKPAAQPHQHKEH